jgi:spore coat protein U-like protein
VRAAIAIVLLCAACTAAAGAASCTLSLPASIGAGAYDPTIIGSPLLATFTVMYACDSSANATNLTITASLGAHASGGSFATRNLSAGGSDRLNYWLYPPGYTVASHSSANVWGDGSGTSRVWGPFAVTASGSASGTATLQIDSNQDIAGGSYSDTVVFTMTFV